MATSYNQYCQTHSPELTPGTFGAQRRLADWELGELLAAGGRADAPLVSDLFLRLQGGYWRNDEGHREWTPGALLSAAGLVRLGRQKTLNVEDFVQGYTRLAAALKGSKAETSLDAWLRGLYATAPSAVTRGRELEFVAGGMEEPSAMHAAVTFARRVCQVIEDARPERSWDRYAQETAAGRKLGEWARAAMPAMQRKSLRKMFEGLDVDKLRTWQKRLVEEYADVLKAAKAAPPAKEEAPRQAPDETDQHILRAINGKSYETGQKAVEIIRAAFPGKAPSTYRRRMQNLILGSYLCRGGKGSRTRYFLPTKSVRTN